MRPAIVVWGDAHELSGEVDMEEFFAEGEVTQTCGWVYEENDEGIVMVSEWWPRKPHMGRNPTFIPHGMVIAVKYLD